MTTKWYNIAIMYSYLIYMYLMNNGGKQIWMVITALTQTLSWLNLDKI